VSMEINVFFGGKLPDKKALSRAMAELGFPLTIKAGSLERQRGFMPMRLRRDETGVEFDVFEGRAAVEEQVADIEDIAASDIDPRFERSANFRWGGDEDEMLAGLCAAAALAKVVDGVVSDGEAGKLPSIDDAIALARDSLQSTLKPKSPPQRRARACRGTRSRVRELGVRQGFLLSGPDQVRARPSRARHQGCLRAVSRKGGESRQGDEAGSHLGAVTVSRRGAGRATKKPQRRAVARCRAMASPSAGVDARRAADARRSRLRKDLDVSAKKKPGPGGALTREEAEDRYQNGEDYLLAARLPGGQLLLLRQDGKDRHDPSRAEHPDPHFHAGGFLLKLHGAQFIAQASSSGRPDADGMVNVDSLSVSKRETVWSIWDLSLDRENAEVAIWDRRGADPFQKIMRSRTVTDAEMNQFRCRMPGFGEFDAPVRFALDMLRREGYGELE
jgi:hypothetical protein